jgi:Sister chromatid cohesion protein PDS5 protein
VNLEEEWAEGEEAPREARLKIAAVKICVNRCLSHVGLPSARDVVEPVLKLLFAILDNMGTTKPNLEDQYGFSLYWMLRLLMSGSSQCSSQSASTITSVALFTEARDEPPLFQRDRAAIH